MASARNIENSASLASRAVAIPRGSNSNPSPAHPDAFLDRFKTPSAFTSVSSIAEFFNHSVQSYTMGSPIAPLAREASHMSSNLAQSALR